MLDPNPAGAKCLAVMMWPGPPRSNPPDSRYRINPSLIGYLDWLIRGETLTGISTGICNETKKDGEVFQLGLAVLCADPVHEGEHRCVEAHQLTCPEAQRYDEHRAPVGRIPFTDDPLAPFQAVQNPRHGRTMQPNVLREIPGAQWTMPLDEIEAGEVHVLQIEISGDMAVEEGELQDHFTKRTGHLAVKLASPRCPTSIFFGIHIV